MAVALLLVVLALPVGVLELELPEDRARFLVEPAEPVVVPLPVLVREPPRSRVAMVLPELAAYLVARRVARAAVPRLNLGKVIGRGFPKL